MNWFPSRDGFFIYRGPYGISHHDGGKFICRWLREYYGGPSCGVTYVAGDTCAHARNPTAALKALYKLAPDEDAARAEELGKLLKRRPEWSLAPRPDEAVPRRSRPSWRPSPADRWTRSGIFPRRTGSS